MYFLKKNPPTGADLEMLSNYREEGTQSNHLEDLFLETRALLEVFKNNETNCFIYN